MWALLSESDKIVIQEYIFFTHRGSVTPPYDLGVVGVIDGQRLKITPFRTASIPPPMAMFEVEAESSIIDVAFAPDNSRFWVLHQLGISVYLLGTKDNRCLAPKPSASGRSTSSTEYDLYDSSALQLSVSDDGTCRVLYVNGDSICLSSELASEGKDNGNSTASDADAVLSIGMYNLGDRSSIYGQDRTGKLLQFSSEGHEPLPVSFPTFLPWSEIIENGGDLLAFGLSKGGHLYVNSRQLVKNCTSFLVTPSHLLFTTSNHLLKFAHLDSPEGMVSRSDFLLRDER